MIGGLQGEVGDLDIKYRKQKISKNVGRKYREALKRISQREGHHFAAKG